MTTFKVVAAFSDKQPKNETATQYTKRFGPFSERRTAEATVVQLAGQASCQSADVVDIESPD